MTDERDWQRPFELSPSEEMILGWIRDGLVDAEIAVRLGVSNADVKERIERLVTKVGVPSRAELREPEPEAEPVDAGEPEGLGWLEPVLEVRRWRPNPVILLVVVVVGAGLAWGLANFRDPRPAEDDFANELLRLDVARYITLEDLRITWDPTVTPLRAPTPATQRRDGRLMYDGGRVFVVERLDSGIASVEKLDHGLRVTLTGQGVFRFENATVKWIPQPSGPEERVFAGWIDGKVFDLHIEPGDEWTDFLYGDWDTIGIFSRGSGAPVVNIWVSWRRIEVEDGHLYIE